MWSGRELTLKSSDDKIFRVDEAVALEFQTIKHLIEVCGTDNVISPDTVIPILKVTSKILSKVIEYCEKHLNRFKILSKVIKDVKDSRSDNRADDWTREILSKVIGFLEVSMSDDRASSADDDLKAWDTNFVKIDQATLFDLILAADYLYIQSLLDLTCQAVADMIKGKTAEEIRETFNIETNYTPEEEEEIRRENQWAFE